MGEAGKSVRQIADGLETTRQTIYKYLELAKKGREQNHQWIDIIYLEN